MYPRVVELTPRTFDNETPFLPGPVQDAILRSLKSKLWVPELVRRSRFTKLLAIKLQEKRRNLQVYVRTNSGRVTGGKDLKATAAYTRKFCLAVCACWETVFMERAVPVQRHAMLADLLVEAGFFPASEALAAASPVPTLRRMTMLDLESIMFTTACVPGRKITYGSKKGGVNRLMGFRSYRRFGKRPPVLDF